MRPQVISVKYLVRAARKVNTETKVRLKYQGDQHTVLSILAQSTS